MRLGLFVVWLTLCRTGIRQCFVEIEKKVGIKNEKVVEIHLLNPVEEKDVDDGFDNPDNNAEDVDGQSREEEALLGLHHPKDDCGVDNGVGAQPEDRPDPVS